MPQTGIGFTQIWDGHGFLIIPGDGLHFIMADGTPILIMDPCGFLITNGDRGGLPGEDRQIITDGRQ